ncbi:MAG: HAMP domain-containing protein [Burkholderiaceae bacterium]|jgi:nitrogen fixation/metabolism regulation signal transduction histidine kinase|nr:HAMP domain-containing protein [Burkholderiaceae bacterium]
MTVADGLSSAGAPQATPASEQADRNRRRGRWATRAAIGVMVAIVLVLLFLLAQATSNRQLYEHYYERLFAVNVAVAALLCAVIGWGIYRLIVHLMRRKFGSRLLVKIAAIFALVGVAPGLLIYVVSYQFVARSIESWFDVKVEGALQAGLLLARTSLETQAHELGSQLRVVAGGLADTPDALAAQSVSLVRAQLGASDASLWASDGRLIASSGQSRFDLTPSRPPAALWRSLRDQEVVTQLEGVDDAGEGVQPRIRALALVPPGRSLGLTRAGSRVIEAVQALPPNLVSAALAVQEANREYQERALGREGLRRMYLATLTLTLFLAVFGAVLLAVTLGKQLATPLLLLADWMRQVAAGDLRPKVALAGRDELGGLTRSFADMTQQLADARAVVETRTGEVEAARASLQTILDNLTAGVIVLDAGGVVRSANPSATRILRQPLAAHLHQPLAALPGLGAFVAEVQAQFAGLAREREAPGLDHWQKSFELYGNVGEMSGGVAAAGQSEVVNLLARGARLPGGGRLLVFDDISEIVSAQRSLAWGEVARRLAHEIKNPLTPIQLSAERLEHKLTGKLAQADQAVLVKSVRTIVDQVEAMKRLVNEFRDYARLPAADLQPLDLNALIAEVLQLYAEESEAGTAAARQVRFEPDPRCPRIRGDAQQLRQVIHNLVQNALDASEDACLPPNTAKVLIQTQWDEVAEETRMRIIDHGHGFGETILKRAFEPYVTTKAKGTGLGLAVVKKIADEHGARVTLSNRVEQGRIEGAQVLLSFCTSKQRTSVDAGKVVGAASGSEAASGTH